MDPVDHSEEGKGADRCVKVYHFPLRLQAVQNSDDHVEESRLLFVYLSLVEGV